MTFNIASPTFQKILVGFALIGLIVGAVASILYINTKRLLVASEEERVRQQTMQERNWKAYGVCKNQRAVLEGQVQGFPEKELIDLQCNNPFGSDPQEVLNAFLMWESFNTYGQKPDECPETTSGGWGFRTYDGISSPNGTRLLIPFGRRSEDKKTIEGFFVMESGRFLPESFISMRLLETEAMQWFENLRWQGNAKILYEEHFSVFMGGSGFESKTLILE